MRIIEKMKIVSQNEITKNIFELILHGELVSTMDLAGQFVNVKVTDTNEPLLRRPISICNIDHDKKHLTLIYRAEGSGTKLLSTKQVGEDVDILGPLGTGFDLTEIPSHATVLLVGGGIGVPPMYEVASRLKATGHKVISVLGFSSKQNVFYEKQMGEFSDVYVATMDGTHGTKGTVMDAINIHSLDFDYILACGPKVMLKALDVAFSLSKKGFLSFEERMACGIGACYACVCQLESGKQARVCKEGPVFRLGEVSI